MFKTVLTLFRGSIAVAGEEIEDRSALLILDQQMRDAAAAVERSKRTLALAIAQDQQEGRRLDATNARIADLELRATAALDGGREDLARDAAQSIANLEADRDAAMTARTLFASEIARLKRQVANAEARITYLDRGRRLERVSPCRPAHCHIEPSAGLADPGCGADLGDGKRGFAAHFLKPSPAAGKSRLSH